MTLRDASLGEHDRHAVERHQPAQLADEDAERLVEVERRRERAGAAARRLEDVDAATELVAKVFRLARSRSRRRRPPSAGVRRASRRSARSAADPEREGDAIPDELRRPELALAPPLAKGEVREQRDRQEDAAEDAVAQRGLDDDEDQRPARRAAVLERVQQRVAADDDRVERSATGPATTSRTGDRSAAEEQQRRAPTANDAVSAQAPSRSPGVVLGEEADLDDGERTPPGANPRDPALDLAQYDARRSSPLLDSRQRPLACSRSSSSSPPRTSSTSARSSSPPTLPAATSALRRR